MASEIIATIGLFITLIVLIVTFFKTRHTERMALINSGRTARIFDEKDGESNGALKIGLFILSIGLGLLIGMIVDSILQTEPAGVFVSILVLGGFSLIIYHFYIEGKRKERNSNPDELI
jgi:FtsH-binding integral membrane protein